jgi:glycosyltransferase involved in cell wall biosynthesis
MISIIITTYNDSEHLIKTIASCLIQDIKPEIIIVDDCSTNPIKGKIMDFIHTCCKFIRNEENIGLAESRDKGIKSAKEEFILPLDTEDWLYPDILGRMLKEIGDSDILYGNMTEHARGRICVPPGKYGITREGMLKMNQLWCTSLFRKSIWEKVGGYENGYHTSYEDFNFWNKCLMAGAKFKYVDMLIYNHTLNPNSMLSQLHVHTDYYNELAKKPLYEK